MMKYYTPLVAYITEPVYIVADDKRRNYYKVDLLPVMIKRDLREKNIQRERDTRKGIWRY